MRPKIAGGDICRGDENSNAFFQVGGIQVVEGGPLPVVDEGGCGCFVMTSSPKTLAPSPTQVPSHRKSRHPETSKRWDMGKTVSFLWECRCPVAASTGAGNRSSVVNDLHGMFRVVRPIGPTFPPPAGALFSHASFHEAQHPPSAWFPVSGQRLLSHDCLFAGRKWLASRWRASRPGYLVARKGCLSQSLGTVPTQYCSNI